VIGIQSKAKQSKAKQSKAKQSKAKQSKAKLRRAIDGWPFCFSADQSLSARIFARLLCARPFILGQRPQPQIT
jgi:hypothetical protein